MQLILYILFFISGFSALIYQLMWQRLLFTLFGVDLTSVTIIVSVFMFGLGLGGIVGGWLADKQIHRLLTLYIIIEFGIGLYGFASPRLIESIGLNFFNQNEIVTAFLSFIMLAVPTILMGMTFPILVTHVNRTLNNVGNTVGRLYSANTIGAALGTYFAGFFILSYLDMLQTIYIAAAFNLLTALSAMLLYRKIIA